LRTLKIRAVVAAAGVAALAAPLTVLAASPAHADDPITVRLIDINDFHGRIDGDTAGSIPLRLAQGVQAAKAEAASEGYASTLFLSVGDNIGASLFDSAFSKDAPTIAMLNALGVSVSAVGNHEFDQGLADLNGRVAGLADFPYLGANVYVKGTKSPVLPEFATTDVDGITFGFIGAVTKETASLVSPGGIKGLTFGDPVAAVNRVAGELTDGDPDNGEADVLIALYHEGASDGTKEGATLDQELAVPGAFKDIVEKTSSKVSVIFTGHTHKEYVWDAPMPGGTGTRPVIQTGSYGDNLGQVDLTVTPGADGVAVSYEGAKLVPTAGLVPDTSDPVIATVQDIVTGAVDEANAFGSTKAGTITDDITTAYSTTGADWVDGVFTLKDTSSVAAMKTGRDQRELESAMGHFNADAMRDVSVPGFPKADIGLMNPGGLRDEFFYQGDTTSNPNNTDGVVTVAEVMSAAPFNNLIWYGQVKGSDLLKAFEQQWQVAADGAIPSRPYLQLGLSRNVRLVTTGDIVPAEGETAEQWQGGHVTAAYINGKKVLPNKTYTVVTNSYLGEGGDNFTALANGTWKDSGAIDNTAYQQYVGSKTLSPEYGRRQIFTDAPRQFKAGKKYTVHFTRLDITSIGAAKTTQVTATAGGKKFTAKVDDAGAATLTFTVPKGAKSKVAFVTDGIKTRFSMPVVK